MRNFRLRWFWLKHMFLAAYYKGLAHDDTINPATKYVAVSKSVAHRYLAEQAEALME